MHAICKPTMLRRFGDASILVPDKEQLLFEWARVL